MTDAGELGQTLLAVARAFDALGAPWAIGGSVASSSYGEPRSTNDVDVITVLDEGGARALTELLGADFYADAAMAAEAARARRSFNVIDTRSFIKVDVFLPPPGPLGSGQLDRRRLVDVVQGAPALPVLSAEDVVLQKLRWYALTGESSERQWRDVIGVLRNVGTRIDTAYLDTVEIGALRSLLVRARAEAAQG